MQKQVLRSRHGNRALLSNHLRSFERCGYYFFLTTLNNLGDETKLQCFFRRELPSSVRKLAGKRLVTGGLGKTCKGTDVGC